MKCSSFPKLIYELRFATLCSPQATTTMTKNQSSLSIVAIVTLFFVVLACLIYAPNLSKSDWSILTAALNLVMQRLYTLSPKMIQEDTWSLFCTHDMNESLELSLQVPEQK